MLSQRDQINRVTLYSTALSFLGTDASPRDQAIDDLGCADSLSGVYKAFGPIIRWSVSTAELYNILNTSPQFRKVTDFRPGDIIISPTGMGTRPDIISNGHVGIVGENEEIMSNSSATGLWTNNYTVTSWVAKYRKQGGYPIFVFRKI